METTKKTHWENVYQTKNPDEVSWTQENPKTSLALIHSFKLNKQARIIDVGGGDSRLVDYLLEEGYENISVLDISEKALEKAKIRLGAKASKVSWIVSDVVDFTPKTTYDVWHDRAAFHFLTSEEQIAQYLKIVSKNVIGYLAMGTFSKNGPLKCSGLEITQYAEEDLKDKFKDNFTPLTCFTEDHLTPFDTTQNFLFCSFEKI